MRKSLSRAAWAAWLPLAQLAARHYVVGARVEDAVQVATQLNGQGLAGTICYWNGETDAPRSVADQYLAILKQLSAAKLNCYLSIKATALGFSRSLLSELVEASRAQEIRLHFDSMWPEAADSTYELLTEFAPLHPQLSCTLPGRWQRSLRDAERAIELGLKVRVVKGQWSDPDDQARDPHTGFLEVVERLAGRAKLVAVATHDPALARAALQRLRQAGTLCELELLFGLPMREPAQVAREAGVPVRIYVPYGAAWVPYCLSQMRQQPRLFWRVAQDMLFGRAGSIRAAAHSGVGKID